MLSDIYKLALSHSDFDPSPRVFPSTQQCSPWDGRFPSRLCSFPTGSNFSWLSILLSSSGQHIGLSWHGAKRWPVTGSWELCKEPPGLKEAEKAEARFQVPPCPSLPFTKSVNWLSGPCGGAGFRKTEKERAPCCSPWSGNSSRQNCKWMLYDKPPLPPQGKLTKPIRLERWERYLWSSETAQTTVSIRTPGFISIWGRTRNRKWASGKGDALRFYVPWVIFLSFPAESAEVGHR